MSNFSFKVIANKQFTFIEIKEVHNSENTTSLSELLKFFARLSVLKNT